MPEIVLQNIEKIYPGPNGVKALADIELTIQNGEFVSVIGPSGCGKSTLLEIIAGLQPASRGQVLVDGVPVLAPSRRIGVVFQDSSLFPWRTVLENVELGLELQGKSKAARRDLARKYIDLVNLQGFEHRYPHQLSGGMRQRIGLARTLINDPKVLLMDEPFGAVDHLTRIQLQDELLSIWEKDKKTVVFITHDVSEAIYLSTRVVLLSARPGRIRNIHGIPLHTRQDRNNMELIKIAEEIYGELNYDKPTDEPDYYL